MRIKPAPAQAFVIEDAEDYSVYEKTGLQIPEDAKKGVGSTGIILAVTHECEGLFPRIRHWLFAERIQKIWRKGDHVIYDKFIANDIYIRDESGEEIKRLKCVPIDCILGSIE